MRKGLMITILAVVLIGLGGWWVWIRSAHGFSANSKPTWIEAELAALSRRWALPGSQNDLKNPYPATPERLQVAHQLFHTQCALCHNENGDGHTAIGGALYPKTPDLGGQTQAKSDGALFYSIRNGIRLSGMPAWSGQDTDEQIWGLVSLIRSLKHP
ncbi:MAG TPA: c-type cytochrome [Terriglobales bacterium]|jgi:mono/diheme cytochrome c family protein